MQAQCPWVVLAKPAMAIVGRQRWDLGPLQVEGGISGKEAKGPDNSLILSTRENRVWPGSSI